MLSVWFLRRRDNPAASEWWAAVAAYPSGAHVDRQGAAAVAVIVCDAVEARQALAWARAHPLWRDDTPALEAVETVGGA